MPVPSGSTRVISFFYKINLIYLFLLPQVQQKLLLLIDKYPEAVIYALKLRELVSRLLIIPQVVSYKQAVKIHHHYNYVHNILFSCSKTAFGVANLTTFSYTSN